MFRLILGLSLAVCAQSLMAAQWSTTQVHFQYGDLKNPFSGQSSKSLVTTLQHSSGYKYGDNFFFIDLIRDDVDDGYQDTDYYGEWYSHFSFSKITGNSYKLGPLKDVGFVMGVNMAGDANVLKLLPGIKLSWDMPGFKFFNTAITAYIDESDGITSGGAPKQSDSWMFDVSWGKTFMLGEQKFHLAGHMEYIASRSNELGDKVSHWILAQPAIQWDLGHAIGSDSGQLLLGIEYQYWQNKLGTNTNESAPQLMFVWTF